MMTKIKFTILGLIAFLFSATIFISCSKEENTNTENQSSMFSKKESTILQSKYGFKNVSSYIDKSNSLEFCYSIKTSKILNKTTSRNNEDLDLTKITEIVWENGNKSYFVPYLNNPNKSLVVSEISNGVLNFENATVINNSVDLNGNGIINVTTSEGSIVRNFENGIEVSQNVLTGKRTFRECFDAAYNDVCDGFVGCVAWYSNPGVPLAAAAYCQIHG